MKGLGWKPRTHPGPFDFQAAFPGRLGGVMIRDQGFSNDGEKKSQISRRVFGG
jgi:hypothetical protein